ncbi:MAG: Cof-type HAD-IIB family hydrolase [Ruminococcus sp.]|nr:Cof-type HAD-IIB family hydrolase [Ruminococcus sp.]
MKTLYISDLDGTLLNSGAVLSDYTADKINSLIERGMYFTFATARTIYSAGDIVRNLNINVPCILNNGAEIYDINSGQYVKNAYINPDTARRIVRAFRDNGLKCFVFKFIDGRLATCYDNIVNENMRSYVSERRNKFNQPFIECADVENVLDGTAVYINSIGSYESLLPVRNAVMSMKDADCAFYCDTYTHEWYLEIFSSTASKGNGLKFLRQKYGFEQIIAFGDNLNDLSMFEQADIKIAVGNADSAIRTKADIITDTNDKNGVADFLLNNYDIIEKTGKPVII